MKTVIIVLSLFALGGFYSCKQDSKKVFEDFADISIPTSAIMDEGGDQENNNRRILNFQLNDDAQDSLIKAIKQSQYYKPLTLENVLVDVSLLYAKGNRKALWFRNKTGYAFYGVNTKKKEMVTVNVDTIEKKSTFQYLAD